MYKWLKKNLIPHKANSYKPHILRDSGAAFLLVLIIASFALSISSHYAITKTKLTSLVLSGVLVDFANNDRAEKNFGHLSINPTLQKAAQLKANDMAQKGYFAHTSPEGKSPWYWFKQAGYDFNYAGENLAINFNESVDVNTAWMNSPGHRANILNEKFTEIGVATAEGMYQGKMTTFVVQLFGAPKAQVASKVSVESNKPKNSPQSIVTNNTEPRVLSESVSSETVKGTVSDLYIAVENPSKSEVVANNMSNVKYSNYFERIMSSPRRALSIFYAIISVILLISLFSFFFIEIKREHYKMIILAALLLFIMFGILYFYRIYFFDELLVL